MLIGPSDVGQTPVGTIQGTVTINGVPAEGVRVARAGFAVFTDANGMYVLENVPVATFSRNVGPGGNALVEWSPQFRDVMVSEAGAVATADFAGTLEDQDVTFPATLTVSDGLAAHDPFVFNAGPDGRAVRFEAHLTMDGAITLQGSGGWGDPSNLPLLTGTANEDGTFTATGAGPIAGVNSVLVVATGFYFANSGGLGRVIITVGGNGGLPGGQSITYSAMFRAPRPGEP